MPTVSFDIPDDALADLVAYRNYDGNALRDDDGNITETPEDFFVRAVNDEWTGHIRANQQQIAILSANQLVAQRKAISTSVSGVSIKPSPPDGIAQ